jgi:hypothetical protein
MLNSSTVLVLIFYTSYLIQYRTVHNDNNISIILLILILLVHNLTHLSIVLTVYIFRIFRLVSLILFLNDLPEGQGSTMFPALNTGVTPEKGESFTEDYAVTLFPISYFLTVIFAFCFLLFVIFLYAFCFLFCFQLPVHYYSE